MRNVYVAYTAAALLCLMVVANCEPVQQFVLGIMEGLAIGFVGGAAMCLVLWGFRCFP